MLVIDARQEARRDGPLGRGRPHRLGFCESLGQAVCRELGIAAEDAVEGLAADQASSPDGAKTIRY